MNATHRETAGKSPEVSVIVPVLNEHLLLGELTARLAGLRMEGAEILVVDGGSDDGTGEVIRALGFVVLQTGAGRARQMNAGARRATGDVLLFLHADTEVPDGILTTIPLALHGRSSGWGRFDVEIKGQSRWLPVVSSLMNLRSRFTGIATGDQAIFVRREVFDQVGGFPEQPLMEDVELSSRLRQTNGFPVCLRPPVVTSGRRWDTHGAWKTIMLMWRLRWAYWRGVPAEQLAAWYR